MAQTAIDVINKAKIILLEDESEVHWTDTELLGWLNDGQRDIVKEKPTANPNIQTVKLAAGAAQSLPSGSILLLDVNCNMGTNGTTEGNAITVVERTIMDKILPGWRAVAAATEVLNVIYDNNRTPKKYWVYPKSPGTNYIEIITADLPDDIDFHEALSLGDEYAVPLMHYCLAYAFAKDAEYVLNDQKAISHYNQYLMGIGALGKQEQRDFPIKTGGMD